MRQLAITAMVTREMLWCALEDCSGVVACAVVCVIPPDVERRDANIDVKGGIGKSEIVRSGTVSLL